MAISKKIIKYLDAAGYKYEVIEHKTTYTAWDTAQTAQKHQLKKKIKTEEIAKALVMKTDKNYVLALLSASKKLDKKKLLKVININLKKQQEKMAKSLNFAKEVWMKKNMPGKVGATPPFREIVKLDIYMDNLLARQKNIYAGSGEYEYSIKLSAKQYLKIEQPVKGVFSVKM